MKIEKPKCYGTKECAPPSPICSHCRWVWQCKEEPINKNRLSNKLKPYKNTWKWKK